MRPQSRVLVVASVSFSIWFSIINGEDTVNNNKDTIFKKETLTRSASYILI